MMAFQLATEKHPSKWDGEKWIKVPCMYGTIDDMSWSEPVAFQMICPRCKVDRVTTPCPNRGGIGDCPVTGTAQNAAPVSAKREWVELSQVNEGVRNESC